jgi:hypothetical protein
MLSEAQIQEYITLYEAEFGEKLSPEAALESALELLNLVREVYKPIKKQG